MINKSSVIPIPTVQEQINDKLAQLEALRYFNNIDKQVLLNALNIYQDIQHLATLDTIKPTVCSGFSFTVGRYSDKLPLKSIVLL